MATNASERRKGYSSPAIVARRKRILDITRTLIAEKGYAQFSVGEVGQRAGVAKQTIYNIFGTRERIIATAINDYFEERESAYRYASAPATMERMIERHVVASRASASMRSGSAKRALSCAMARATWWLCVSTVAIWRSRAPASPVSSR